MTISPKEANRKKDRVIFCKKAKTIQWKKLHFFQQMMINVGDIQDLEFLLNVSLFKSV